MFAAVDADKSGYIDYTEFIVASLDQDEFSEEKYL